MESKGNGIFSLLPNLLNFGNLKTLHRVLIQLQLRNYRSLLRYCSHRTDRAAAQMKVGSFVSPVRLPDRKAFFRLPVRQPLSDM